MGRAGRERRLHLACVRAGGIEETTEVARGEEREVGAGESGVVGVCSSPSS